MKFGELLKYNLSNQKDLEALWKHQFTTNEVLLLIQDLTSPSAGLVPEKKKAYLEILRACKSHSSMVSTKYIHHIKAAIEENNPDRLLSSFAFILSNVDLEKPTEKIGIESFVGELKRIDAPRFLHTMLGGYKDDDTVYEGLTRKRYIAKEVMKFFKDNNIFATPETATDFILKAQDLKEGVAMMRFFVDAHIVKEGFSHNFLIQFLNDLLQKGSQIYNESDLENFLDLPITYKDKTDEEALRKLLLGLSSSRYRDLKLTKFLFAESSSATTVRKLLKEIVLDPQATQEQVHAIFTFLNFEKIAFEKDELKVFLDDIKSKTSIDYAEAIFELRSLIGDDIENYVTEIDAKNLVLLSRKCRDSFSKIGVKEVVDFVDNRMLKISTHELIEFLASEESEESFDLLSTRPRLDKADLEFACSRAIAHGSTAKISEFLYASLNVFADKEERREFAAHIFQQMVDINLSNPNREEGKPFFDCQQFYSVLDVLRVQLNPDLILAAADSLLQSMAAKPDENLHDDFVANIHRLLGYVDTSMPASDESLYKMLNCVINGEKKNAELFFKVIDSLYYKNTDCAVHLSKEKIKEIYVRSFANLVAENSNDPDFTVTNIRFSAFCKFSVAEILQVAQAIKEKSANPQRGFALALISLTVNREYNYTPSVSEVSRVKLSELIMAMDSVAQCDIELAKISALRLFAGAMFENDCDESFDEKVLEMLRKFVAINKDQPDVKYGFYPRAYQDIFATLFYEGGEEEKLSAAGRRIIGKMDLSQRLIFLQKSDVEIGQENVLEILMSAGRDNHPKAFQAVCVNFLKYVEAHPQRKFSPPQNPDSLLDLLKLIIAKNVEIDSEKILKIFRAISPDFAGFPKDSDLTFVQDLAAQPRRLIEIFRALESFGFQTSELAKVFEKSSPQDDIQAFILSANLLNEADRKIFLKEILMPKILRRGNVAVLFDLNEGLTHQIQRSKYFLEMADYMKVGAHDDIFWLTLQDSGLTQLERCQFILKTYKDDSAISSTQLRSPLKIDGIDIVRLEQVEALFNFFPDKILPHIGSIARDDELVRSLNMTMKFYSAKYFNLSQFKFLQAVYKERQESGQAFNLDMKQLVSYEDLLQEKSQFKEKKPVGVLNETLDKKNLREAILGLKTNRSFAAFYDSLKGENPETLGLKKVDEAQLVDLRTWIDGQYTSIDDRCEALKAQNLTINPSRLPGESDEAFAARKLTERGFIALRQEKQKLAAFLDDSKDPNMSIFDKFRKISEIVTIPDEYKDFLEKSAHIEQYQALRDNVATSQLGGCFDKFLANLDNNIKLCDLITDEKELATSLAAQLSLVRLPNCYANLKTVSQREIERRRYETINHGAIAMGMFQGILPFIGQDVHNNDEANVYMLKQLHLAKNSFCYNVGEELLDVIKKEPKRVAEFSPAQHDLFKSLKNIDVILADEESPLYQVNLKQFLARSALEEGASSAQKYERDLEILTQRASKRLVGGRVNNPLFEKEKGATDEAEIHLSSEEKTALLAQKKAQLEQSQKEEFNAFLAKQKIELTKMLGFEGCKLVFSKKVFAGFAQGFSIKLEFCPLDIPANRKPGLQSPLVSAAQEQSRS